MSDKHMSYAWDLTHKRRVDAREISQEKRSIGDRAFREGRSEKFRCVGCYDLFQHQEEKRDPLKLPKVQFRFEDGNRHSGWFRLWQDESHEPGCRFINPYNRIVSLAQNKYGFTLGNRGAIKLQILPSELLNRKKTTGEANSGFRPKGNRTEVGQPRVGSARIFEDIYQDYGESGWEEIPVETGQGRTSLGNVWITSDQALQQARSSEGQIMFVQGRIRSVKQTNYGYIHLYYETLPGKGPVKIILYPDTIYKPEQLQYYKNRLIGCYGELRLARDPRRGCEIVLYTPENQIALLDRKPNEVVYLEPKLDLNRAWQLCEASMKRIGAQKVRASPPIRTDWYTQIQEIVKEKAEALRDHQQKLAAEEKYLRQKVIGLGTKERQLKEERDNRGAEWENVKKEVEELQKGIILRWWNRKEIQEKETQLESLEKEIVKLEKELRGNRDKSEREAIKANNLQRQVAEKAMQVARYQHLQSWVRLGRDAEEVWSTLLKSSNWQLFEIPDTCWSVMVAVCLTAGNPERPLEQQNETQLTAHALLQRKHKQTGVLCPSTEPKTCKRSSNIMRMQPYSVVNPRLTHWTICAEIQKELGTWGGPPENADSWLQQMEKEHVGAEL